MKNKHYLNSELKVDAATEVMPFSDIETEEGPRMEDVLTGDPRFWSPTGTPEQSMVQEEEEQELQEEIDKKMQELLQSVKEGTIPPELDEYQKLLFDMHAQEHPEQVEHMTREQAEASFRKFFFDNLEEILSKGVTQFILKR
jgi:hypothetical protein